MLLAEIHGKYVLDAQTFEDYLTSTVFGHLRYIQPGLFWEFCLDHCRSLPIDGKELSAADYVKQATGTPVGAYETMDVTFWPNHPQGSPDVLLLFAGRALRPVVVCIEAKLFATKSGTGEDDQLARYLRACDSLNLMQPAMPTNSESIVVYLTTHDSRGELLDSLAAMGNHDRFRERLYRLEWKDIIRVAEDAQPLVSGLDRQILGDVSTFLKVRRLDPFGGMTAVDVPIECDGRLFASAPILSDPDVPEGIECIHGGWLR